MAEAELNKDGSKEIEENFHPEIEVITVAKDVPDQSRDVIKRDILDIKDIKVVRNIGEGNKPLFEKFQKDREIIQEDVNGSCADVSAYNCRRDNTRYTRRKRSRSNSVSSDNLSRQKKRKRYKRRYNLGDERSISSISSDDELKNCDKYIDTDINHPSCSKKNDYRIRNKKSGRQTYDHMYNKYKEKLKKNRKDRTSFERPPKKRDVFIGDEKSIDNSWTDLTARNSSKNNSRHVNRKILKNRSSSVSSDVSSEKNYKKGRSVSRSTNYKKRRPRYNSHERKSTSSVSSDEDLNNYEKYFNILNKYGSYSKKDDYGIYNTKVKRQTYDDYYNYSYNKSKKRECCCDCHIMSAEEKYHRKNLAVYAVSSLLEIINYY